MLDAYEASKILPFRPVRRACPDEIGDLRFRSLIGEEAWARLPARTRARFGKRIGPGESAAYVGEIVECRMSLVGRLLAQTLKLIGAPLPLSRDAGGAAAVLVSEDHSTGGQFWTRIYGRHRGFPQVVHSSKRFAGPTGLEEYIGCGFGIALRCEVADGALHFVSAGYFVRLGRWRLAIPAWLSPGSLRVSHIDCNHGLFAFVLHLEHRWLGELIHQTAMFQDVETVH